MNEQHGNDEKKRSLVTWLTNPFQYIAGGKALIIGLVVMVITGVLGAISNTHFDGVLDVHMGADAPLWFFVAELFVSWLSLFVLLLVLGLMLAPARFRVVDLLGTQAMARWPGLLVVLPMLVSPVGDAMNRVTQQLMQAAGQPNPSLNIAAVDALLFALMMLIVLLVIIWTVILMYRGYTVSCGLRGARAVISFIFGLIAAEILSKIVLWQLATHFVI